MVTQWRHCGTNSRRMCRPMSCRLSDIPVEILVSVMTDAVKQEFLSLLYHVSKTHQQHFGLYLPASHSWSIGNLRGLDEEQRIEMSIQLGLMTKAQSGQLMKARSWESLFLDTEIRFFQRKFKDRKSPNDPISWTENKWFIWLALGIEDQSIMPPYVEPDHCPHPLRINGIKAFQDHLLSALNMQRSKLVSNGNQQKDQLPKRAITFCDDQIPGNKKETLEYHERLEDHEMIQQVVWEKSILPRWMKPNHLRKAFWRNPKEFEQGDEAKSSQKSILA